MRDSLLRGNGGTLHETCVTFTHKKVVELHLESERKCVKIHTTQLRERVINNSKGNTFFSSASKGPCVIFTQEEWNSSSEKINIKTEVVNWSVQWKNGKTVQEPYT